MADLLNTSISGLLAFQRALDTTSHNIANVNTVGYSRQLTEFQTRQADQSGSGWVGNGVDVSTVRRAYDDFISGQARSSSSSYQQFNTFATQAGRINNLFGDSSTGMTASLQNFINSVQSVADTPTSVPARQTLLSQANSLMQRLQGFDGNLRSLNDQVNSQFDTEASTVTTLARGVAQLNAQISSGYARTGQPPNDLMDQRDQLLDQLATHVNVNVVKQGDNTVNVFIGNGQPLVVGQTAATLASTPDPYDATRKGLSLQTPTGSIDITSSLSGGTLGGMLDFRTQMLDPARNALGRLSVALTDVMNNQHHEGMDLHGNLGGDFFATGGISTLQNANNVGTGGVAVTRVPDSAGALTTSDYELTSTATGWKLQRTDTGASVAMTGTGTAADPFVADGMSIVVSGTASTGDRFLIKPTADAVSGMQVLITDPDEVAVAAPIKSAATAANLGNGTVSAGEVIDANNPQLRSPVTIQFTSPTQYTIGTDPTVHTYTSGGNIDANGWRVQISGTPAAGDSFTVSDNTGGTGDNRNALKLADMLNQPVINGGTTSLNDAAGQFIGAIGVQTNQAQVSAAAQKVVADEGVSSMQSVSGVNLDEEAANLVRYQQAYMAASQMIRVADTIFQSILDAVNG
ncbi:MAG TPA: flagellar hook-associated protein FlgK [Steroidobacteraceae bacterium]|jgi:flagellar hook-associated protein 1 FlgK